MRHGRVITNLIPRENLSSLQRWHDVRKDLLLNPEDLEMYEYVM